MPRNTENRLWGSLKYFFGTKIGDLPEELRKSRRNLLIFSAIALSLYYVDPKVFIASLGEYKSVIETSKLKIIALVIVSVELITYCSRIFTHIMDMKYAELNEERDRAYTCLLGNDNHDPEDFASHEHYDRYWNCSQGEFDFRLKYQYIRLIVQNLSELYLPIAIGLVAVIGGIVEVCPYFTRHFI